MKIYKPSDSRDPCDICGGQPTNENQNVIIVNAVSLLSKPGQNVGLLSKPDDDVDNFSHICHECITAMLDVVSDKRIQELR
jgi:hypothetical protein